MMDKDEKEGRKSSGESRMNLVQTVEDFSSDSLFWRSCSFICGDLTKTNLDGHSLPKRYLYGETVKKLGQRGSRNILKYHKKANWLISGKTVIINLIFTKLLGKIKNISWFFCFLKKRDTYHVYSLCHSIKKWGSHWLITLCLMGKDHICELACDCVCDGRYCTKWEPMVNE